jgi:hypothetical protein
MLTADQVLCLGRFRSSTIVDSTIGNCVLADVNQALLLIARSGDLANTIFVLWANNHADQIDESCLLNLDSFLKTPLSHLILRPKLDAHRMCAQYQDLTHTNRIAVNQIKPMS